MHGGVGLKDYDKENCIFDAASEVQDHTSALTIRRLNQKEEKEGENEMHAEEQQQEAENNDEEKQQQEEQAKERRTVAAPHQDMPGRRNTSALAAALGVKSGNNKIIHQDILTALADATCDLSMPCRHH